MPCISYCITEPLTLTQKSIFIPQAWYYKLAATYPIYRKQRRAVEPEEIFIWATTTIGNNKSM
jgi:hypothetical protein